MNTPDNPFQPASVEAAQRLAAEAVEKEKEYFFLLLHAFEHTWGHYPDEREREDLHRGAWRCLRLYG